MAHLCFCLVRLKMPLLTWIFSHLNKTGWVLDMEPLEQAPTILYSSSFGLVNPRKCKMRAGPRMPYQHWRRNPLKPDVWSLHVETESMWVDGASSLFQHNRILHVFLRFHIAMLPQGYLAELFGKFAWLMTKFSSNLESSELWFAYFHFGPRLFDCCLQSCTSRFRISCGAGRFTNDWLDECSANGLECRFAAGRPLLHLAKFAVVGCGDYRKEGPASSPPASQASVHKRSQERSGNASSASIQLSTVVHMLPSASLKGTWQHEPLLCLKTPSGRFFRAPRAHRFCAHTCETNCFVYVVCLSQQASSSLPNIQLWKLEKGLETYLRREPVGAIKLAL